MVPTDTLLPSASEPPSPLVVDSRTHERAIKAYGVGVGVEFIQFTFLGVEPGD